MRCEDAFNATYGLLELHEAAIFKVSFLSLLIGCVLCNEVLQGFPTVNSKGDAFRAINLFLR
jgi:hypothetical protein